MKKIFLLVLAVITIGMTGVYAQTPQKATTTTTQTKTVHVTKSGAPDKRYKENKTTTTSQTKVAGPVKKDGTPDMRYKANKTTTTTTTTKSK